MFTVYIVYSIKLDHYYTGYTDDMEKRIIQHNTGFSRYTSKACDWVIKYTEHYPDRTTAHRRELFIKKKKSRKYIEWLVSLVG